MGSFEGKIQRIFRSSRAFLAFLAFLLSAQFICLLIADIAKDRAKQVIQYKRQWVSGAQIKGVKGKDLVFFFGGSEITSGVIPEIFDEGNRGATYSYNLALPASPLAPHYFLLRDYLQRNEPPRYIIMLLTPGRFDTHYFSVCSIQGAGLYEVLVYAFLRNDPDIVLNYLLPSK
ncbi:MAG: hypothetical protein WCK75_12015, partial [Elusimicrobiota bacterium]